MPAERLASAARQSPFAARVRKAITGRQADLLRFASGNRPAQGEALNNLPNLLLISASRWAIRGSGIWIADGCRTDRAIIIPATLKAYARFCSTLIAVPAGLRGTKLSVPVALLARPHWS